MRSIIKNYILLISRLWTEVQVGSSTLKRLCGYNMGEWRNNSYGGGAGGGAQKTFYCPYDMVYWLLDLSAP